MGISIETLVASKKFTSETVLGGGAVVGKNVTISSITPIDGGNKVTFSYTLDNGTVKTSTMDVMDGKDGIDGLNGKDGQQGADGSDGVGISKIEKISTVDLVDTYRITFTDNSTFDYEVTNGKDGQGGGTADVPIEKIKVNGELQTPVNKVVDITVPSIEGLTKDADLATVAKSGSYEDLSNKPIIPSLDGYAKTSEIPTKVSQLENDSNYLSSIPEEYVTETELNAKGYLTEHQDISGKVDKVEGKSLIADTEIERLAGVDNYDDTDIKAEIAKKADATAIPSKVSELTNDSNYQTAEQVNSTVTTEIAKVVADAPESLNTLKEMSDWIAGHEDDASAMNSAISDNKTAITALQTGKADKSEIPTTIAELTDSADYAKTTDIPTTLPANGGNSDTVNNHTVKSDVPENAVFTDTTYSDATQIEHGLMSVDDKKKLDGLKKYTSDGTTITADEDGTLHGVKVTVDDALSPTSTNPVQNKVVKAYVDKKVSENVDFSTSTSKTLNDTVEAPLVLSNSTRNLLNPMLKTNTSNGVTCTNNGDGTYTLNGTSTKDRWLSFGNVTLKPGKYKFIATKNNVRVNNLCVALNSTMIAMPGEIFTVQSKGVYDIGLSTYNKTFNNVIIKPMLTTDLNATYDDFVPYSGYDIKTCGKNLLNLTKITTNNTGATASLSNGIITLDRTVDTSGGWQDLYFNTDEQYISLKRGVKYTISTKDKVQKVFLMLRRHNGLEIVYSHDCSTNGTTFVASEDMVCQVTITFKESSTFNNTQIAPQIEVGEKATEYEPYKDGGTVHIDSSTEFHLLGLKSFDGETNIISPGNVEVTYAKSDSGKAILDMSENKLDKGNVVNNQTTTEEGYALDARQANPNIDGTLAKQISDLNGKASMVSDVRKETTVNLLNLTLQTTTQNGLTCTNNGDGTYTLNGTAANQTTFIFANADYTLAMFKGHSSLKLVGFPKKYASAGVLQVWRQSDNLIMRDRGDGVIITGSDMPYGNCNMAFVIYEGAVTDGMIIKPMLTTNLNATYDDFVPYTGDSGSLNWDVASLLKRIETLESLVNKEDTTVTE